LTQIAYLYRWLYYRCYRYSKKADSRFAWHADLASIHLVALLLANLLTLLFLFAFLFRTKFGIPTTLPNWVIGAITAGIFSLHGFFVRYGDRYKKIIGEFSTESAEAERRGDLLFGWYLVLSLFAIVAAGMLLAVRAGFPG